jgi:phosphoribosylanthranilate isomerase
MPVRIKICGITRLEDAKTAIGLGVDALGFIFHPKSPRFIKPADAGAIIRHLPPFVARVGVFVDADPATVNAVIQEAGIDVLQFHGSESTAYCAAFHLPVIKAFSIMPGFDPAMLEDYETAAGFLLDTWDENKRGGTGRKFDWNIAEALAAKYDNIILAGGLGPSNLEEALNIVYPYAVDLNSGVEVKPGVKNFQKMRDAIGIVKNWK